MKRIKKFFINLDVFGVPFLFRFRHKNKDKYSTSLGGLTFIIFCIFVLIIAIYYFIPLFQRKNYSIVYYSRTMDKTEDISLQESKAAIGFGFDCPYDEKLGLHAEDLLELKSTFISYTKDQEGKKHKDITNLTTHLCNYSDFYNEYNESLDLISIQNYQCLDKPDDVLKGIWNDELFTYYEFSVVSKGDSVTHYQNIDKYLLENDCKLQIYYTDITINLDEFQKTIQPYLNSIFLQLDPTLFLKMNIFFMNQHFKDDRDFIYNFEDKKPQKTTLFSRLDKYSLYKGLDRGTAHPYDYKNYAKVYIRADTKRLDIKRKYQNLMECYADSSSLLIGVFKVLCFIFYFINNFYAELSISKTLFYFKEIEENNIDILKKNNKIKKLMALTDPFVEKLNSNTSELINKNNDEMTHSALPLFLKETEEHKPSENKEKKKVNSKRHVSVIIREPKQFSENQNNKRINIAKKITIKERDNKERSSIRNNLLNNIRLNLKPNLVNIDNDNNKNKEELPENKPKIGKIKYSFNLFEIINLEFCYCHMSKNMKIKNNIREQVNNIIYNKFNIVSYIRNMVLLDILNQTLLDRNTKEILKFLSTPIISVNKKVSTENYEVYNRYSEDDFDKFYNEISELVKKPKKMKVDKKLITLSYQQLKELI